MKFISALTMQTEWREAAAELTRQVRAGFEGHRCDLGLLFVSPEFVPELEGLVELLRRDLGVGHLVGCTAGGIVGGSEEVERQPAISLLVGELPGVKVGVFRVTQEELEESRQPAYWHFQLDVMPSEDLSLILLADPFSIASIPLVEVLSAAYPGVALVGGLASGGQEAGQNRLVLDGELLEDGAVGVALAGPVELRTIVAQGCKPIGEPLTVTRAKQNILFELGGRSPGVVLQELMSSLSPGDQRLAQTALLLGRVVNEYKEDYGRGDFLVRPLIGLDSQSGALAVGDAMKEGQTVQFQVRDGGAADEDLRGLLNKERTSAGYVTPKGVVMFSCLGRGEGMYRVRNHDIHVLHEYLGSVPTAGFFCNGEIGPVGGKPFVHGFTSVFSLFVEKR